MKIVVNAHSKVQTYFDPTAWQNSTLRYSPPKDFPAVLEREIGRAKIMRTWITLDEYWDYRTGIYYPDYDIGVARYPVSELHYPYDWKNIVPAPSGTRFVDYLTKHAEHADELLLNVRRYEREVSDGIIDYDTYEYLFENAVEYCKGLAPNIKYIECCNETDIRSFGLLTPEHYVRIYCCAYNAIKRLNARHGWDLKIGGYATAEPLTVWDDVIETMRLISESGLGEKPIDFYSYHHYDDPATYKLLMYKDPLAYKSGVQKIRELGSRHKKMISELGLPEGPVFLNELGRSLTTGQDGDSLYNAAGNITYLIAHELDALGGCIPFPWCTFHNPELQMAYTQFTLNEDGESYSMTPNGFAIKMLHEMKGDVLETVVTNGRGVDEEFCALAVKDGRDISIIIANTSAEGDAAEIEIVGAEDGEYLLEAYRCNARENNTITSSKRGCELDVSETDEKEAKNSVLTHYGVMRKSSFVLYKFIKK